MIESFFVKNNPENKEVNYKNIFAKIFDNSYLTYTHYYRKKLIQECIIENESSSYKLDSLVNFLKCLEACILFFVGLNCNYYLDELGFLNMDFYGNEKTYLYMAERLKYPLQFRILAESKFVPKEKNYNEDNLKETNEFKNNQKSEKIPETSNFGKINNSQNEKLLINEDLTSDLKSTNKSAYHDFIYNYKLNTKFTKLTSERFETLNKIQFDKLDFNIIHNFPPHSQYSFVNTHLLRRYNSDDSYHICDSCSNLDNETSINLTCSSCFRNIDKLRLVYLSMNNCINLDGILNLNEDDDNEENGADFKNIFENIIIMQNYFDYREKFKVKNILNCYINPIFKESDEIRMNNDIRNFYGEVVGLYFVWVSTYLKWLKLPCLVGLLFYIIGVSGDYMITDEITNSVILSNFIIHISFYDIIMGSIFC